MIINQSRVIAILLFPAICGLGFIPTRFTPEKATTIEVLRQLEFDSGEKSCKLDTVLPLLNFGRAIEFATFYLDTSDRGTCMLPYVFDARKLKPSLLEPFDSYGTEGAIPVLKIAFTANADLDKEHELIIQIGWHHDNANAVGWFYNTYIYDRDAMAPGGFSRKANSSKIIPHEAQAIRQGEHLRAKYNSEAKIRRRLKQLGF